MSQIDDLYEHYRDLIDGGMRWQNVPAPTHMAKQWSISLASASRVRKALMESGHVKRLRPEPLPIERVSDMDMQFRFWPKVAAPDENRCTKWMGNTNNQGYGNVRINGRQISTHRLAYTYLIGPIPEGLEIDHKYEAGCRSILCVNIEHLEPVTRAENERRKQAALRDQARKQP